MPTYRHPRAAADEPGRPPAAVHVTRAHNAAVDDDGVFEAPVRVGQAIAADFDTTEEAMRVEAAESDAAASASDEGETSDGDDGDEQPPDAEDSDLVAAGICPWCDEYEGDHVGQHASSAHPDQWATYQEA